MLVHVFDNKIRKHAATYMNRVPLLPLMLIIIAFYDEGAGLVAV